MALAASIEYTIYHMNTDFDLESLVIFVAFMGSEPFEFVIDS